jgi:iron complex transport system substrate-binding protein
MIRMLGGMIGCEARACAYADGLRQRVDAVRDETASEPIRPRVYFEEWDDPNITGIRWVSELIGIAGGDDIFPERASESLARNRIIADPADIAARRPDIVIGSWCGKKFRPERVASRLGWEKVPAVAAGELHEVKSSLILQPGPAALTDGVAALRRIIGNWQRRM